MKTTIVDLHTQRQEPAIIPQTVVAQQNENSNVSEDLSKAIAALIKRLRESGPL